MGTSDKGYPGGRGPRRLEGHMRTGLCECVVTRGGGRGTGRPIVGRQSGTYKRGRGKTRSGKGNWNIELGRVKSFIRR